MSEDIVEAKIRFDTLLRQARQSVREFTDSDYSDISGLVIKKVRSDCVKFDSGRLGYFAGHILRQNYFYANRLYDEANLLFEMLYVKYISCSEFLQSIRLEVGGVSFEKREKRLSELRDDIARVSSTMSVLETVVEMCQHYVGFIDRISSN